MNSSYIQANIHIPLFFFPLKSYLQVVRLSHGPVCLLLHFLCPFKFWQTLLHWSTVQYQIAESKCSQWDCWQKLFLSFASLGALVLLVLSSPPISQSGEAAAFYLIWMKYSPFVRSPVLENLVYFAFCFITVKERIQMSSLLPLPPTLSSTVMCWQLPKMEAMDQQYLFSVERWFKFSVEWNSAVQFFIRLHCWESFTFDFISLDPARLCCSV